MCNCVVEVTAKMETLSIGVGGQDTSTLPVLRGIQTVA